jgi:hypothetical protein
MKYVEQRLEELEREILKLKAKVIKMECERDYLYDCDKNDTSHYLYNYPPYPSVNIMSEPDLETAFASPFDKTKMEQNPLNTVTVDTKNTNDVFDPPYPNIVGSWDKNLDYVDSFDLPTYYPPTNPEDVLDENKSGFKTDSNTTPIRPWSPTYDKMDKDFLEWMKAKADKKAKCSGKCSCK